MTDKCSPVSTGSLSGTLIKKINIIPGHEGLPASYLKKVSYLFRVKINDFKNLLFFRVLVIS
jgi:hypothetical protein